MTPAHLSFANITLDNPVSPSTISLNIKCESDPGRAGY